MTNLVYVQFNPKLLDKKTREKEQGDVSLAKEARKAIGWTVEGGDNKNTSESSHR